MYKLQGALLSIVGLIILVVIFGCFIAAIWAGSQTDAEKWGFTGFILIVPCVVYVVFLGFVWEDVAASSLVAEKEALKTRNDRLQLSLKESNAEIHSLKVQLKEAQK